MASVQTEMKQFTNINLTTGDLLQGPLQLDFDVIRVCCIVISRL